MIKLKRVYEPPAADDGFRVLVERLWPRGMSKEQAKIDLWLKDIAPSLELRSWFAHDPAKWPEFRERYQAELRQKSEPVAFLRQKSREGTVTFVYAARDQEHNAAAALKSFVEQER